MIPYAWQNQNPRLRVWTPYAHLCLGHSTGLFTVNNILVRPDAPVGRTTDEFIDHNA